MGAHASALADPALTIALALLAGMVAHALARHLHVPGIVLLLATGVLLGPDVLDVVRPGSLGHALHDLVGFAVAVILFDGGMNLNLERLRREALSIRQLVTAGALVTAVGGTLAARLVLDWEWTPAILFGTLVIVTGPTVITPLLRRIKVTQRVGTVLEAEGVLGDAIGAIVAVVALEVAISPVTSLAAGGLSVLSRLGFGALVGAACGLVLAAILGREGLVPEGLESVFTLSLVVAMYQASNAVLPESGIVSVIAAGIVVGNARARVVAELREFKEQLTVMLIGLLFVLLAADVRLYQVTSLGWAGVATVLALMLLVRPANVLVGTAGSDLAWRERAFIAWLAPRGIVAAAVSSLFAQTLAEAGIPGGTELRAMVFLVIAITVVVQGLTGGLVADLLGVRRPSESGWVILGANALARAMARALGSTGEEVVLVDSNPDACRAAEAEGLTAIHGSGLDEEVQRQAQLDTRSGCLGLTANEEVNLLFAGRARKDYKLRRVWVALRREHLGVDEETAQRLGARVLFGEPQDINLWALRLRHGGASIERWARTGPDAPRVKLVDEDLDDVALPLVLQRGRKVAPVDETSGVKTGDLLQIAIAAEAGDRVRRMLRDAGWTPVEVRAAVTETATSLA